MDNAVVCIMSKPNSPLVKQRSELPRIPQPPATKDIGTRTYVDIQCINCGLYGRKHINCDKMAQFILLQKATSKVNDKIKSKILENYNKVTQKRRERHIKCMKGTMRQLFSDGYTQEAYELLDQYMQHHLEDDDSDSSDCE